MREILFRGLRYDGNGWVYGMYLKSGTNHHKKDLHVIYVDEQNLSKYMGLNSYTVIPETVGQYTGLKDKNGVKIFEGDNVKIYINTDRFNEVKSFGFVYFKNCSFLFENENKHLTRLDGFHSNVKFEVIGNIHENK